MKLPKHQDYYLISKHRIKDIARIYLRKLVRKLPQSITERHYLRSLQKYDRKAGSYVATYINSKNLETSPMCVAWFEGEMQEIKYKTVIDAHLRWLANSIIEDKLEGVNSLIEIGAGELTTIAPIKIYLKDQNIEVHASELSWSRLKEGREYFHANGIQLNSITSASVLELPYQNNSFDCVLAHYFLEELVGYQERAIKELIRISSKYVVLIEASYELGNKYQRRYLLNRRLNLEIIPAIKRNKWQIIEHSLVPFCNNAYYHGAIHIIKKDAKSASDTIGCGISRNPRSMCCPKCHGEFDDRGGFLKCEKCSLVFPVLDGIPVLLTGNAIVASKY